MRNTLARMGELLSDFTFRLKLRRCWRSSIGIDSPRLEWRPAGDAVTLVLSSGSDEVTIRDAEELFFTSSGWASADDAAEAAARYAPALLRSLARLRVGVDEGRRGPAPGGWTTDMIARFWDEQGIRVINDAWGLMVYESEPRPVFSSSSGDIGVLVPEEHFTRVFKAALDVVEPLTKHEQVALDFFNASFFQKSADSRMLMLMMALEALVDPAPRSEAGRAHVAQLIAATEASTGLALDERDSIVGTLRFMRRESIRQTGLKLVDKLGNRTYMEMRPRAFFDHCYNLRSALVHGAFPAPSQSEVGGAAASLEVMVSDLISGRLRDVDPNASASG